jgi:hypothetical protein
MNIALVARRKRRTVTGPAVVAAAWFGLAMWASTHPKPNNSCYWLYWTISCLILAVTTAACVYGILVLLQYLTHSTPCQRMGTC